MKLGIHIAHGSGAGFYLTYDRIDANDIRVAKAAFVGKRIGDRRERDNVLLETKRLLMYAMLCWDIPKDKIRSLVIFMTYYVNFEFKETNTILKWKNNNLPEAVIP
ncbi:hypothetical protein JHJ32_17470 [Parapedobacter sp. ISTM3]|uniref:Uncharacterized protein n=1 Tax=Parapedobacter luteus TaxID=623280 RepID=A0A1T5AIC9_9SPHI|nr:MULTISPECIES: hypothetical protein [Parapedobacter]MBK1441793.1 hypothetical protein [Parapedobacter sp. ISTM3]SKB34517.1 hypothetical protein SAMN05660226_00777 [Parapedobacter luteus]